MLFLSFAQSSSWELYDAFEAADAAEAEAEEREAATEKENNAAGPAAQARTEEAVASKRYSDSVSQREKPGATSSFLCKRLTCHLIKLHLASDETGAVQQSSTNLLRLCSFLKLA